MKINNILLITTIASVFWNAAADVGALRGLEPAFDPKDKGRKLGGIDLTVRMAGDPTQCSVLDLEKIGEAIFAYIGFDAGSMSLTVEENLPSGPGRRNLQSGNYWYGCRCGGDDDDRRELNLPSLEGVNKYLETQFTGSACSSKVVAIEIE